tara:strand:+ start:144031 stop:144462 length:432 start_codon:yes stop_codon:yes gene_type:complete
MSTRANPYIDAAQMVFVLYTLTLLTATHWPGLAIKGPFSRTDLIIHAGAFGLWTLLLGVTGWVQSKTCIRKQALMAALIGIAFGIFDETTQPMFNRVFDLLDLAADAVGAILASLVLMFFWYKSNGGRCRIDRDDQHTPETLA